VGCDRRVASAIPKEFQNVMSAHKQFFSLRSPGLLAKTFPRNNWGGFLSNNTQEPNINVVRSVWRRLKKDLKEAIIRDLQLVKDVKGGGGFKGESKPPTGGAGRHGH